MDYPVSPDKASSFSQLSTSPWIARAHADGHAGPDRDVVQWQSTQSPCTGLRKLMTEASKPIPRQCETVRPDSFDPYFEALPLVPSTSMTSSSASTSRLVGPPLSGRRPRSLRAYPRPLTPSSSMASVRGDPTMFFGLLKDVSEQVNKNTREKQQFMERAREKEREKARKAALLMRKSKDIHSVRGGRGVSRTRRSTSQAIQGISEKSTSITRNNSEPLHQYLDGRVPASRHHSSQSSGKTSAEMDADDDLYMDGSFPMPSVSNSMEGELDILPNPPNTVNSPLSATSIALTQSTSTSSSFTSHQQTQSPELQRRSFGHTSNHGTLLYRATSAPQAESTLSSASIPSVVRIDTDSSKAARSFTTTNPNPRPPRAPPTCSALIMSTARPNLTPPAPRPSQRPPALGMRRTHVSRHGLTPSQSLPTKQRPFRPPLAHPHPTAAPPAPVPAPKPSTSSRSYPPPPNLPTPNPSLSGLAPRPRSPSPPAPADPDTSYGDISIDADLLEVELAKYDD
ncbi:hypothetical protein EW146_g2786 [Bondarzewia mesenterica]|uniref:Uncharacterized protein n=1 Tax=Bondarzewia mesenterica TaxID=1095465 RepID=A0A4S4LZP8_9AGAM|nr:hypothetical protein EW146_g2786 [Bondarzewia mesenterica]